LIQSAIIAVLTEGGKPRETSGVKESSSRMALAATDPYRGLALRVFDDYRDLLANYVQLFNVAFSDYIVVVAVDSRFDEHLLTYESPLYVDEEYTLPERLARLWRLFRASRQGYYVKYRTYTPTTLRSYHMIVESTEGVDVERIFLTTNAHEDEVNALSRDL